MNVNETVQHNLKCLVWYTAMWSRGYYLYYSVQNNVSNIVHDIVYDNVSTNVFDNLKTNLNNQFISTQIKESVLNTLTSL